MTCEILRHGNLQVLKNINKDYMSQVPAIVDSVKSSLQLLPSWAGDMFCT